MDKTDFRSSLETQARHSLALGSPFMARLMRLLERRLAPGTPLADRLLNWPGDTGGTGQAVALRLAGGLHALVLSGHGAGLAAAYPPNKVTDDILWRAVQSAMEHHAQALDAALDRPPQTNEVRRSATIIVAAQGLAQRFKMPFVLSEIGASAGLNLNWDRYALEIAGRRYGFDRAAVALAPEWRGAAPPQGPFPQIVGRRGVDLAPLDPANPSDPMRLLSYIWPDQVERFARTLAALALPPAPVDQGDALPWLKNRLAERRPGILHLVFHTLCWPYLDAKTRTACEALFAEAGARATADSPLARFQMEPDVDRSKTALLLTVWPDGSTVRLGSAGFHGEWIDWLGAD